MDIKSQLNLGTSKEKGIPRVMYIGPKERMKRSKEKNNNNKK
jgi:hypothetical protein